MNTVLGEGRYHLDEPIGYGGMATVYRAEDERLRRTVAVKVLADNLAADPSFRERFLREARLAARLSHPNVVRVFDVDEAEARPFIVMECVGGGTLADALRRSGPLPPTRVAEVAHQAAAGLAAAHDAGLVHRDIKPGNLLLADDGTVKIADFGIARAADSAHLTRTGAVLGTEAYLAPEQAEGLPATAATDVFALGVVLYEALTGNRLLGGEAASAEALTRAGTLGELIGRALSRQPEDRPTAAAIAAALGGYDAPATDPNRTDELAATGVLPATSVLPAASAADLGATAVVPALAAAGKEAWAQPRVRLAAALAVFAVVGIAAVLLASRPDEKRLTTSTTVVPTTAASTTTTTVAAVAPPVSTCAPINVIVGGMQIQTPNPNCVGASGADAQGADGADGADGIDGGVSGNAGDGADGADGADGRPGKRGKNRG